MKRSAAKRESERLYTVVDTTWGAGLIAWTPLGLAHVELPRGTFERVAARGSNIGTFARPTGFAADAARRMRDYFGGEAVDLDDLPLDLDAVPPFARKVYAIARSIARGKTETYGDVATRIGSPGASRAVGGALGRNPIPLFVPCHRVIAAGGRVGGFSATGGVALKRRMLALESGSSG